MSYINQPGKIDRIVVLLILANGLARSCHMGFCGTCSKYQVLMASHVSVTLHVTCSELCICGAQGKGTLCMYPTLRVPTICICEDSRGAITPKAAAATFCYRFPLAA